MTPRTAAGRALLDDPASLANLDTVAAICAIEDEAARDALVALREQVEAAVPVPSDRTYFEEGWVDCRREAVALIDAALAAEPARRAVK